MQYLEEKLAINSFTFGFELEAVMNDTSTPTNKDAKPVEVDKDVVMLRLKRLEPILRLKKRFGGSYMRDGSIKANDYSHIPFEYVSGVLKFNDQQINAFSKAMLEIKQKGVYTNESCGFHIHFGFPDTTRKQLLWIKTVYIFDSLAQSEFEYFQSSEGVIPFWSKKYASVGNKKKIARDLAHIIQEFKRNKNAPGLNEKINKFFAQDYFTSKYNVLGIHEKYRTLEWRGPRGFLATKDTKDIINFVHMLRKFVSWISNAEDTEHVAPNGSRGLTISRQEFFDMVEHHTSKRTQQFGVDIADQIDAAKTDARRAALAYTYFQNMDFQSRAATNYRKIANRIKSRYPKAWDMFMKRVDRDRTFPEKAKIYIKDLAKKLKIIHESENPNRSGHISQEFHSFSEYLMHD